MGDEPGYFCSCINAMAVSRAEFDAQSLELSVVVGQRDYATKSNAANYDRADKAEKELQAVREALTDATHRIRWMLQYIKDIDVGLIEDELAELDAALKQSRGAT